MTYKAECFAGQATTHLPMHPLILRLLILNPPAVVPKTEMQTRQMRETEDGR